MFTKVRLCKHNANKKFPNGINISVEIHLQVGYHVVALDD